MADPAIITTDFLDLEPVATVLSDAAIDAMAQLLVDFCSNEKRTPPATGPAILEKCQQPRGA